MNELRSLVIPNSQSEKPCSKNSIANLTRCSMKHLSGSTLQLLTHFPKKALSKALRQALTNTTSVCDY